MPTALKAIENPTGVSFLDLNALHAPHAKDYEAAFQRVFSKGAFIGGEEVKAFEDEFSRWVGGGCKAVGCGNGTDAITLAAKALGLKDGSEVVLPAMTFYATAEALLNANLRVSLVDIDAKTWLMSSGELSANVTSATELIVPVHLYGQMAEMDRIREIADEAGAKILEDAAQAHGATWNGKPVGYWGDLATYSFYPGKNLGAFGDGGAVIGKDEETLSRIRAYGDHGGLVKYQHDLVGHNSRLDGIQAAILREKLKHIDGWNQSRRSVAGLYHELLSGLPKLILPYEHEAAESVYHLFVVQVEDREDFRSYLDKYGVGTGVHYPKAIHEQPALKNEFKGRSFKNAERLASHGVSLPMGPTLSETEIRYVAEIVHSYYGK